MTTARNTGPNLSSTAVESSKRVYRTATLTVLAWNLVPAVLLTGLLRRMAGRGGGFIPIDLIDGLPGRIGFAVGVAVALLVARKMADDKVRAGATTGGIGAGTSGTFIGWAAMVALAILAFLGLFIAGLFIAAMRAS